MIMLRFILTVVLMAWPPFALAQQSETNCLQLQSEGSRFLKSLPGSWEGSAPFTPLGKLPYNIEFNKSGDDKVIGKSFTNGQAVHTWTFSLTGRNALTLDFHSTFGDSRAQNICVTKVDAEKGFYFSMGEPSRLSLWIKVAGSTWKSKILLSGKSHVTIEADRPVGPIANPGQTSIDAVLNPTETNAFVRRRW